MQIPITHFHVRQCLLQQKRKSSRGKFNYSATSDSCSRESFSPPSWCLEIIAFDSRHFIKTFFFGMSGCIFSSGNLSQFSAKKCLLRKKRLILNVSLYVDGANQKIRHHKKCRSPLDFRDWCCQVQCSRTRHEVKHGLSSMPAAALSHDFWTQVHIF